MVTWGGTSISIRAGSYQPAHAEARIQEILILPSSSATDDAVVLQHMGTDRRKIRFVCESTAYSIFETFQTDHLGTTIKQFVAPPTTGGVSCIVSRLRMIDYQNWGDGREYVQFEVVLTEETGVST